MPLPKRRAREKKDDFINRCMSDKVMVKEYPDAAQRRAVCETQSEIKAMAAEETYPDFVTMHGEALIEAAENGKKLPTFKMKAYTGGEMQVSGFYRPVVIDLEGLKINKQKIPVRLDHESRQGVGHTERVAIENGVLIAEGVVSLDTTWAKHVVTGGMNGFPWQASIGAKVVSKKFIPEKTSVEVNGRSFIGPLNLISRSTLKEISFVDVGADSETEVSIAAQMAEENNIMDKKKEKKTAEEIEAQEKADLEAKEKEAVEKKEKEIEAAGDDPITKMRETAALEAKRLQKIHLLCKDDKTGIEAKAITEGWDENKTELELMRANRPAAPGIIVNGEKANAKVLEASMVMQSMAMDDKQLLAYYDEKTLDLADKKFRRMTLKGLIEASCSIDGRVAPSQNADHNEWVNAAFSTNTMASVVSDSANKSMLVSFRMVQSAVMKLFKRVTATNFLTHTGYRNTGGGGFKEVGQDGELKHGDLADDSKTYSVTTYGEILGITRQMIINDDIGALTALPVRLGQDAAACQHFC